MEFKSFLLMEISQFQTAKGSVYQFINGKTIRNKTPHNFHEPDDVGVKKVSDLTVFVDEMTSRNIGMWSQLQAKTRLLLSDKIVLISWNTKTNNWGRDAWHGSDGSYKITPELGLCPVELWDRDLILEKEINSSQNKFVQVYKKVHAGNKIMVMK